MSLIHSYHYFFKSVRSCLIQSHKSDKYVSKMCRRHTTDEYKKLVSINLFCSNLKRISSSNDIRILNKSKNPPVLFTLRRLFLKMECSRKHFLLILKFAVWFQYHHPYKY